MSEKKFDWPVVGHNTQVRLLTHSITQNTTGHAYLFLGQRHTGKKFITRLFAQSLLCTGQGMTPCKYCENCSAFTGNNHPDVHKIDVTNVYESIGIDEVREFNRLLHLKPALNEKKIGIILNAERLTMVASNALLKLLEDSPKNVTVLLTANSSVKLPPTLVSRCQLLKFKPVSELDMKQWLKQTKLSDTDEADLLHLSMGRISLAKTILEDSLSTYNKDINKIIDILDLSKLDRMRYILDHVNVKNDNADRYHSRSYALIDKLESLYHDVLLVKLGDDTIIHLSHLSRIKSIAKRFTLAALIESMTAITDLRENISRYINTQLSWEAFLLKSKL